MIESIEQILDFLFSIFSQVASLYTTVGLLAAAIGIWVLGKVINYLRRLMP